MLKNYDRSVEIGASLADALKFAACRALPSTGLALMLMLSTSSIQAQPAAKAPAAVAPGAVAPAAPLPPKKVAPKPEEVELETIDGAKISATYFAGTAGKESVPVILLHMSKGTRADFKNLPLMLQAAGHAVIVPDLRGHGKSTRITRAGREVEIDQATMRKTDLEAMVLQDMEAIKKFLIDRNNAGELNIRKLCVVGAELGSVIAMNWAALEWSWPMLTTGPQGQDIRALVLLTPAWNFKTLTIRPAMQHPDVQSSISMMIVAGSTDQNNLRDAKRLHQGLEKYHPEPPANQMAEKKDLFMVTPATSLQGTKMLGEKSLKIEQPILEFINLRLVKKSFPWSERKGAAQ